MVDQEHLALSLYPGEYLPILFSHYGKPSSLKLSLEHNDVTYETYCDVKSAGEYVLRTPHVLDLEAQEGTEVIAQKGKELIDLSSRMLQDILSRRTCEYLFKLGDGRIIVFAGIGSAKTFRDNFYNRLTEVFFHFEWLHKADPKQFPMAE